MLHFSSPFYIIVHFLPFALTQLWPNDTDMLGFFEIRTFNDFFSHILYKEWWIHEKRTLIIKNITNFDLNKKRFCLFKFSDQMPVLAQALFKLVLVSLSLCVSCSVVPLLIGLAFTPNCYMLLLAYIPLQRSILFELRFIFFTVLASFPVHNFHISKI